MMKENYQVAELEVSYKPKFNVNERPQITKSKHVYSILLQHWDFNTIELLEEFKILLMNRNNRILGIFHLSYGGMTSTVIDPKIVFSIALKACACGLILAHNHPSGNLEPSNADLQITRKLVECGNLLEIEVKDHVIVSRSNFYSFADNGLI